MYFLSPSKALDFSLRYSSDTFLMLLVVFKEHSRYISSKHSFKATYNSLDELVLPSAFLRLIRRYSHEAADRLRLLYSDSMKLSLVENTSHSDRSLTFSLWESC